MILFLDFDGVLHPFPTPTDPASWFCNLPRLESVLRDFPTVLIVVTSTMREAYPLPELAKLFAADIAPRVVGMTPVLQIRSLADVEAVREREIEAYLTELPERAPWVALDDDAALYQRDCRQLVHCRDGFGEAEEAALRRLLAAMAQEE
jgi:hypothetical protein